MAASAFGVLALVLVPLLLGTVAPLSSSAATPKPVAPLRQQSSATPTQTSPANPSGSPASTPKSSATTRPNAKKKAPAKPAVVPPKSGKVDCRKVKCIALSFDDGPGDYTDQVLAILKAGNARASFFMIGRQISSYPAQVRRVQAAGHELGNHTWSHPHLGGMPLASQRAQINRTQDAFAKVGVKRPVLMRPPFGDYDANTSRSGMGVAMWSVDTEDWLNLDPKKTTQRALAGARPGGIILLHEIHASTLVALPGLIAALQARGYAVVSISQMCGKVKPGTVLRTCPSAGA